MAITFVTSQIRNLAITTAKINTGAVTNAKIGDGEIENGKLVNSTVSYGGVSLALGATDATPAFNLADATGLPISSGVSGLASGVATFLATPSSANLISAVTDETGTGALVFGTSPTLTTPNIGTPSAGTLSSCTGLPISSGVSGLGANVAAWLADATSAKLATAVTDETGTGSLVFSNGATLVAPVLGTPASGLLSNCTTGTPSADAALANKAYVDSVAQGLDIKDSVKAATTANITLSGTQTIDGVAIAADDRVLVKDQSTGTQNGIYLCKAGAWARATDFDTGEDEAGAFTFVEQGTVSADTGWVCTNNKGDGVVGTNALVFSQFSGAGSITAGNGLSKSGSTLSVDLVDSGSGLDFASGELQIAAGGVSNAMLAGSIADSKLNQITTADKVAGSAVELKANGGLSNSSGLQVEVDTGTVTKNGSGQLMLADDSITLAKLGLTPKFQLENISGSGTGSLNLTNRVPEAAYRDGGWISVFRNGQRLEYKASGASDNGQYAIADNGSATSVTFGANLEDGDVIFIQYLY